MGKKSTHISSPAEPTKLAVTQAPPKAPLSAHLAETAWRVALPFMVFSLGGIWLDGKLDAEPVWTLVGLVLGLAGAGLAVYRFVNEHYPETFRRNK